MDYLTKNHAKYLVMAHLIFVCTYRKTMLVGHVSLEIKGLLYDVA